MRFFGDHSVVKVIYIKENASKPVTYIKEVKNDMFVVEETKEELLPSNQESECKSNSLKAENTSIDERVGVVDHITKVEEVVEEIESSTEDLKEVLSTTRGF